MRRLELGFWIGVIGAVLVAPAAGARGAVGAGCVPSPLSADRGPVPAYFWPAAEYGAYLEWLHRTVDASWQVVENFPLEKVLTDLALKPADLGRVAGATLLAGEACLDENGLFGALARARGGSTRDLVALDLVYHGRTAAVVEGTVTRLPFADDAFAFVFSHMVAHYLRAHGEMPISPLARNQQVDFIRELVRVLRPGGEARVGLFVTRGAPRPCDEIAPIRAALDGKARVEVVKIRPGFSTLVLTKIAVKPR